MPHLEDMKSTGIIWTILCSWFIITYRIEHWDEVQKTYIMERNKAQDNRISVFRDIRKYVMEQWLPQAVDDTQRVLILDALGKFMSMANVENLKEDFALIHTSIADALQLFLLKFETLNSDIYKSMSGIMNKENRKKVDDSKMFPKEMLESELRG